MDIIIRLPKEVADTKLGKTKLLSLLKSMGAEVVGKETSQINEVPAAEDIQEVFDHHKKVLGSHFPRGISLNTNRRTILRARRRSFSVDQLKQVIDYVAQSPFHLGANDANKKYLDFDHIMSNDLKVERKLDGMVGNAERSQGLDEIRLTLKELGAKIRSDLADYADKDRLANLNARLWESCGERYNWRDDTFTQG